MKPRLLDLFCGAGGAAMGYSRSGFDVVGVDIRPQPRYPFEFVQADALEVLACLNDPDAAEHYTDWLPATKLIHPFDAIHASPPCQAYSVLRRANPDAEYADLIQPTRELLEQTDIPWVIENVPGAPLRYSIFLCGSMFGLGAGDRQLRRHRLFETSFPILQPTCQHDGEAIGVYGGGPTGRYTFENGAKKDYYNRRGGYQGTVSEKQEAMEIGWMNAGELNQAIPPAYCELIGAQLLDFLRVSGRVPGDSAPERRAGTSSSPDLGNRTPNTRAPVGNGSCARLHLAACEETAASSLRSERRRGGQD